MKLKLFLAALIGVVAMTVYAQVSSIPSEATVRLVSSLPAYGFFPGQIVVVVNTSDVGVFVWNGRDLAWEPLGGDDADLTPASVTTSGNVTVTGNLSVNGDATLGSDGNDLVTVNSPITFEETLTRQVLREDFGDLTILKLLEEDFTAPVVTDASQNMMLLNGDIGIIGYRWEQAFAGTVNFIDNGYLVPDADDVDNDGITLFFGSARGGQGTFPSDGFWDEDNGASQYCEVSLLIADISEVDILWFGYTTIDSSISADAGDWASFNTSALFVLSDAAGDLDIVTELNNGGTLNDDTGVTWADGQEKTLRVVINPDSVSFVLDGSAVTQTNAVLNFDDTDLAGCQFGYVNATGDATPAPGIKINYVEIGVPQ